MLNQNAMHQLIGVYGSYVYDLLCASDYELVQLYKHTQQRFVASEDETLPIEIACCMYHTSIETLNVSIEASMWRSSRN